MIDRIKLDAAIRAQLRIDRNDHRPLFLLRVEKLLIADDRDELEIEMMRQAAREEASGVEPLRFQLHCSCGIEDEIRVMVSKIKKAAMVSA